jgi:hypothetical protein
VGGSLLSYIYSAPPLKVLERFFFITDSLWKILPWDATCLLIERCSQKPHHKFQLKQNGWIGNFALGASYISLPWYDLRCRFLFMLRKQFWFWCYHHICTRLKGFFFCRWAGQALFGTLTPDIIVLTTLYSIAGVFRLHILFHFGLIIHTCHDDWPFYLIM